jgi:hypothetical protein
VCPQRLVSGFWSIDRENAEEVLQASRRLEEGMSFKIKDDITSRPRGESCEAASILDRQLPPADRSGTLTFEL